MRTVNYHRAAVVHVVQILVSVGAEVETRRDAGERPTRHQSEPAVCGSIFELHLIGVGFGCDALVQRRDRRGETLQLVFNIRFLDEYFNKNMNSLIQISYNNF